ncbi:MAG: type II toxin-antitoxin system MqsR family toxin [Deltaproteobacteria bacterium]|nr:type II toxin-antitoxin system MqsR family toxin [Deltaproteobacteria bacterium]
MGKTEKERIGNFLKEFKKIATQGRGIDLISRRKNLESLAGLGLTKQNCRDEILSLSVADYCSGPKPDRDRPGKIWEFGKTIVAREIYIKLKIAQVGTEKIAKCLSFHAAEFPLHFPCREGFKKGGDEK